ncbi:27239_t:CDS:10 [Gigaspora margarita]|uniref:27239_t:CDS:1 n=1 Tax=Gigaspora margarita TaxID=4874 RepID=A0ABM8VVH6_GIGMA|nr:27239_t:CDS:10 [Gigaspora margarita]
MLQIENRHRKIIHSILSKYPYQFYAYGSRVKNQAKKYSDLDICFHGKIPWNVLNHIQEDLEESDLPFKVELGLAWKASNPNAEAKFKEIGEAYAKLDPNSNVNDVFADESGLSPEELDKIIVALSRLKATANIYEYLNTFGFEYKKNEAGLDQILLTQKKGRIAVEDYLKQKGVSDYDLNESLKLSTSGAITDFRGTSSKAGTSNPGQGPTTPPSSPPPSQQPPSNPPPPGNNNQSPNQSPPVNTPPPPSNGNPNPSNNNPGSQGNNTDEKIDKLNDKKKIEDFAQEVIKEIDRQAQARKKAQKEEKLPLLAKLAIGGVKKRKIILDNYSQPSQQVELAELKKKNNYLEKCLFSGQQSCLITVAAANILCSSLEGKSCQSAQELIINCQNMIEKKEYNLENCPDLQAFSDISKFPHRIECIKLVLRGFIFNLAGSSSADLIISSFSLNCLIKFLSGRRWRLEGDGVGEAGGVSGKLDWSLFSVPFVLVPVEFSR